MTCLHNMPVVSAVPKALDTLVMVILADTFIGEMLDLMGKELFLPCCGKATQFAIHDNVDVLNQVPHHS